MKKNFEKGMFIEKTVTTNEEMAASRFHDSSPHVISTPSIVGIMQSTCADLMAPFLDSDEMVVSVNIELSHIASAPIGSTITVRAEIDKIREREIVFKTEAFDESEKIAYGYNDMFIIDRERFAKGVNRKKDELRLTEDNKQEIA